MKITSRLALNGLIRNKKRTVASCIAISLATVMITANSAFMTSAMEMLKDALGGDMGDYLGAYNAMIVIPAIFLMLLIVFISVTVISNIFRTSANNRVKELGVLRCVGGTSKQIRRTVISEGLWLSLISIPLGLILGTALGYIGVGIAGIYLVKFVETASAIAVRKMELNPVFAVKISTYAIAAIVSFITIMLSSVRPAKQLGKISAIECVRFGNRIPEKIKEIPPGHLRKILWGFEGELGARNVSRNKESFKPAIRALVTGISLILATAGIFSQLAGISRLMKSDDNYLIVDYVSLRDEKKDPETGRRSNVILNPIDSETYQEINDKLNEFGDFEVYGIGSNRDSFSVKADSFSFTDDIMLKEEQIGGSGEMEIDLVSMTDNLYRRLCEASGTPYGGNILINVYRYNDFGTEKEIVPFEENIDSIVLVDPAGEEYELAIDGYLSREDTDEWYFNHPNVAAVQVIVPGAEARFFDWYCEPGVDEDKYVEYAKSVMDSFYMLDSDNAYEEQGFTVRISREDDMVKALNIVITLAEVIIYGFVTLIALIGFSGFISSITVSLRMRANEFAVLKSVGMTGDALKKMIYCESMFCTLKASVNGILIGVLIPFLINLAIRNTFPVKYTFPFVYIFLSVGCVFAIVLFITRLEIKRIKSQSLIEIIRMDSM